MTHPVVDDVESTSGVSQMWKALTFTERCALLSDTGFNDSQRARIDDSRFRRWKAQAAFDVNGMFETRLKAAGVTEARFREILETSTDDERLQSATCPQWIDEIEQACCPSIGLTAAIPQTGDTDGKDMIGFLNLVEPLARKGHERLCAGVAALQQGDTHVALDLAPIAEQWFMDLYPQLLLMISRTMVLELRIAGLENQLDGETPEARFQQFCDWLRQPDVRRTLFHEYPVLARQIWQCIEQRVDSGLEFLGHLAADWQAIRTTFCKDDPGQPTAIDTGAGDSHRGGKAVVIIRFASGFQLVYKPRSLAADAHFQEFASWFNDRSTELSLRHVKVMDCGSHGWMEFVSADSCSTRQQVERFYERLGALLAIMYVLQATDFHAENLIAAGEHPVLIDLESLFQPTLDVAENPSPLDQRMVDVQFSSVLVSGLLPNRMWSNADAEGIDISGLGARAGQLLPDQIPYWDNMGTDSMHLRRRRMEFMGKSNRPALNGQVSDPINYRENIVDGFSAAYRLLVEHRVDLLAEDGPVSRFCQDEIRVILRPTRTYEILLSESFHPDVLRDGLDRDCHFDRLWNDVASQPRLKRAICAECADLQRGDIPVFSTRPDSRDIRTSSGQRIENFLDQPTMASVRKRIAALDPIDLDRQRWFLKASLSTIAEAAGPGPLPASPTQTTTTTAQVLDAAYRVGDRLEALAFQEADGANWLGLAWANERNSSILPLRCGLYDGLAGVTLFLAYLADVSKQDRYATLAANSFRTLQRYWKDDEPWQRSLGAFSGWGGMIYTLTHLGTLWNREDLLEEAIRLAHAARPVISNEPVWDIEDGAAGCIAGLLALYDVTRDDDVLLTASQCGGRLIDSAQKMPIGSGWVVDGCGPRPLSGFAHGAAGIGWSLLGLAAATGQERFHEMAMNSIRYERSLFSIESGNWRDLRHDDSTSTKEPQFMVAWCHGAPGIGMARLTRLSQMDDAEVRSEIAAAVRATLDYGSDTNDCLCHGTLGNLELLLLARETLDDTRLDAPLRTGTSAVVDRISQLNWQCGVPMGVETPGLMTGLAGIGYGLLRLVEPHRVPSVLVLQSPRTTALPSRTAPPAPPTLQNQQSPE